MRARVSRYRNFSKQKILLACMCCVIMRHIIKKIDDEVGRIICEIYFINFAHNSTHLFYNLFYTFCTCLFYNLFYKFRI